VSGIFSKLISCLGNIHYDAAASWEGAQSSKPEDLPVTHLPKLLADAENKTILLSGEKQG